MQTKSKIQLEAEHHRLCENAAKFHKLISSLCPTSIGKEGLGSRINIFSRLVCINDIDLMNNKIKNEIDELFSNSRSSRKKVFTAFMEQGLLEKTDYGKYRITQKGIILWHALQDFNETLSNDKSKPFSTSKPYYEHVVFRITTDGENFCKVWHNWCIRNTVKEPQTNMPCEASSDTPFQGTFRLKHSDNIEKYDLLVDDPYRKCFNLILKKPVNKGEYLDFWYEYDWPELLKNIHKTWDYSIDTKEFPIKHFTLMIELPLNHKIDENKVKLDIVGKKALTKDFFALDPLIWDSGGTRYLYWRMHNVPGGLRFKLSWEHS